MGQTKTSIIPNQQFEFIVTPSTIYFRTRLQTTTLQPYDSYCKRYYMRLRSKILRGEITDLDELSKYCGTKVVWVPRYARVIE